MSKDNNVSIALSDTIVLPQQQKLKSAAVFNHDYQNFKQ